LYSFLSQVMPFQDPDLEKRYTFGRFLQMKLPRKHEGGPLLLDDEVSLKYYRLQQISQGDIVLRVADGGALKGPTDVGTRAAKDEKAHLSEIIDVLNERFGAEFTKADQLFFDQISEEAKADEEVVQRARVNELANFELAMRQAIEDKMIDRIDKNSKIVEKYLNDRDFQEAAFKGLVKRIYEEI